MSGTNITDFLLQTGRDGDVAVVDAAGPHTYADLRAAVATIGAAILDAGLRPGATVAVIGPNSFFWIAAYLAAMRCGTVVPLSDKLTEEELAAQLDWVGCLLLVADRRTLRRIGSLVDHRSVITDELLAGEPTQVRAGVEMQPGHASQLSDSSEDAVLMFTSGTTSRPKAVRITHRNLLSNTESIVTYLNLRRTDRMLVILPFHYCFGASLLHTHLSVGGSVVLCNTFAFPETALDLIEREACTGIAGVPSTFQLLLRASGYAKRSLPSLRLVQQAGGRLPPSSIKELAAAQPATELYVMYGQTEATARLSYLPPDRLVDKLGSIGKGIPGVDLTVVDGSNQPIRPGERGEIVARGANISPGYYRDPEETARKFQDGALRTGDMATVDEDGFLFVVGRSEDFIKSWGHRVAPQQIEEVALTYPGISDAAVVGVPDAQAGERIVLAIVQATPGSGAQDLMSFLGSRLAKHMVPQLVLELDALPLNTNGKISRAELRSVVHAHESRSDDASPG